MTNESWAGEILDYEDKFLRGTATAQLIVRESWYSS
jgi:hypothetical protein